MPKKNSFTIKNLKKNKFSLILSGGSSLGLAHIGVIKFLEKNNLQPSEIIGTSIGSIVGALYAIGNNSKMIEKKLEGLTIKDLFEVKYLEGKIHYKKAKNLLKELLQNKKMNETKIPLRIIATHLKNGKKKIFTNKNNISIYEATLASSAIPGLLSARKIKNEFFIDGGVSSNLPIEIAKEKNIKLAINVINGKTKNYHHHIPKKGLINNLITKLTVLKNTSRYYIKNQTESKIPSTSKLILIEPNLKRFNPYKIINHKKMINSGYKETKKYFDESERSRKRKHKKKKTTAMEKLISLPIMNTKKILRSIKKINS